MTNYHDINDNIESLAGNNLHRGNEVIPVVLDALTSDVKTIDLFKYDYMWADSLLSLIHMEWHSMPEVNGAHPTVGLTFAQAYTPTPSGWAILNRLTTKPAIIHNVLLEVTVAKYSTGATVIIDQSTGSLGYEDIETFYIYIPTDGYYHHTSQKLNPMVFYLYRDVHYRRLRVCIATLPKEINIDWTSFSYPYSLSNNSLFIHSLKHAYSEKLFIRKIRIVHTKSFITNIDVIQLSSDFLGDSSELSASNIRRFYDMFFRTSKSFDLKVNLNNQNNQRYIHICRYESV
jgi:hypothetical protein